jgi:hypothetical protein
MTHDRGGAAVIGAGALLVLIADLIYTSAHWSGSFRRSFAVSLAALAVLGLAFRFVEQIGKGRRAARWNQRGMNIVLVALIVVFLEVGDRVGGDFTGETFGALAGLAGAFAMYCAVWLAGRRS